MFPLWSSFMSINSFLKSLLFLFPHVSSSPLGLPNDSDYTSSEPDELQRVFKIRIAALTCSGVSMTASLVAFYWFCRMETRFRHRLIMLLIYGDFMRATWYFVFSLLSLVEGTVKTESSFCQSSGFFMQYGENTSDYAVLVIAVHSAFQVLRSSTQTTSEGLYPYRVYVYVGALLIPCLMAGLAFVNSGEGYSSLGAFCTLPIRPFWYRLALSWIPRYMIALIIIGFAIAINAFVSFEFRRYSNTSQSTQNVQMSRMPSVSCGKRFISCGKTRSDADSSSRIPIACAEPVSENLGEDVRPHKDLPKLHEQMDDQRQRVRRQLRLMFVYPLIYTLMWLIPFVHHCMMYFDKYTQRPIWLLRLSATVCITSIGFVDCLVFSLREKPWQRIPTHDESFRKSISVWIPNKLKGSREEISVQGRTEERGLALSKRLTSHKATRGERAASSDDHSRKAAENARSRLELEREERHTALRTRAGESFRLAVGAEGTRK